MSISHRTHHSVALPLQAILLALVLVFNPLSAAPTTQDACSISCNADQASVLKYENGEYLYELDSIINTEVVLPSPESRQTHVKAKVAITANSACDFVLRVKALSVSDNRGENLAPVPNVQDAPARFTLDGGAVGSVCVAKDEQTYTANIKRAVISLLQNRALEGPHENEIVESDIAGKCPTKYSVSGDDYVKTKRLNACQQREGGLSVLHGVPYEIESNLNSLPGLASTQTCEQHLENGIYTSIKCTEVHAVKRPITRSQVIRTTVTTTLTLQNSKKGAKSRTPPNLVRSSILFDYHDEVSSQHEEVAATRARELIEQICNDIGSDGISEEVPVLLLDLQDDLVHVTKAPLTQLYNDIKSGSVCAGHTTEAKKLLADAAAQSGSDGAIGLLSELYQQGELSKFTKRQFYLYTTFAPHPHEEALQAVLPLLSGSGQSLSKRSVLTASGLAHQFCKVTHPDCLGIAEYDAIVNRIAQIVTENLADDAQSDNVVTALQALGNLEHLTAGAVAAITAAEGSSNERIRIRALDASRRDPCQPSLRASAQGILSDHNNSPDVRINAYLANLRCLQPEDTSVIQNVLNDPESAQVSGFIYTSLKNLARSSSQSNRHLQDSARQIQSQLHYPDEIGRLSRNLESSLFSSTLNLGYSAEGNVIFSKDSLVLRQASANLTVDIFGQSYNLLELGVYLENLGNIQETLLGPNSKSAEIYNRVLKRIGINRSNVPGPVAPSEQGGPARIDVYVRVHGTTVGVVSVSATRAEEVASELKNKIKALLQGSVQTSNKDFHAINPILLANKEVIVPTVSGFGLDSHIEATFIPSLDYSKSLQLPEGDQPFDLKLRIGTNVAAAIRFRHSIIGGPIESGVQLEGSLRSGGSIDLALHHDSQRTEARVNLPNNKLRAFDVSANAFWISRAPGQHEVKNDFRPSLHVVAGPETCDCPVVNALLGKIGLKACLHSNVDLLEGTRAIWNGRQYITASLEKTESSMQGYALVLTKEKNGNKRNYELSLDTPGSTTNRKISVVAHGEDDEQGNRKIDVEIQCPVGGPITIQYERTNNAAGRGIEGKITTPSGSVGIHGAIARSESGNEITYKPALEIEYPELATGTQKKANLLTGTIVRVPGQSATFDVSTQLPSRIVPDSLAELFIKGSILANRNGPSQYEYELQHLQVGARARDQGEPKPILEIDGKYKRDGSQQNTDLTVKYGRGLPYTVTYHKGLLLEAGHLKLDAKVSSTRLPLLNSEIAADIRRDAGAGKYDSNVQVTALNGKLSVSSQSHVVAPSLTNIDVQNTVKLSAARVDADGTYDISVVTHAKNELGVEQLLDVQVLKGEAGAGGKITLKFDRKAANNNDFTLQASIHTKHLNGELLQTRETVNDEVAKSYTSSYKYETTLSSALLGIEKEHLVTYVRLLNKPNKKGITISAKNTIALKRGTIPDLSLDLSVKSTPEKASANVDFKSASTQVASLEATVLKKSSTTEPQILLKSFLAKVYRINLTRRTPEEGQAITKVHADILPTGRTVTLEVTRRRDGDVRKLDADLKWDSSRDPSKSIQVHSVTKIIRGSIIIESRNDITVVGNKVSVNVDATIPTDIRHGEHSATVTLVGTDGNSHTVSYKNNLNIEKALRTSKAQVTLNSPVAAPIEIDVDVQSANPDLRQLIVDLTGKVDVLVRGARSLTVSGHFDSGKDDNGKRNIHTKVEITGEALPGPASLESSLTLGGRQLTTKTTIKAGNSGTELEIGGELESNQYRVANLNVALTNAPLTQYKKVVASVAHRRRADGTIDISRSLSLTLDGQTALKYRYALSLIDGTLSAAGEAVVRDRQIVDASIQGTINRQQIDVSGKIHANDIHLSLNTHVNLKDPLQLATIGVDSGAYGASAKLERTSPNHYALSNTLKINGKEFQVNGDATIEENDKSLALKYVKSTGEVAGEVDIHVTKAGDVRTVSGSAGLGSKKVELTGSVSKIEGGYQGEVHAKGPGVDAVGKISAAINGDHRHIALSGGEASHPIEIITLDYNRKSSHHSTGLEGTFSTELLSALPLDSGNPGSEPIKGTFNAAYNHLEPGTNGEDGCQLTLTSNIVPATGVQININSELKATDLELLAQSHVTVNDGSGITLDKTATLQLKRPAPGAATKNIVLQANLRNEKDHQLYGVISKTAITIDPRNVEHTSQLVLGDEKTDVVGVHVHAKSAGGVQLEGEVDLLLPSRTISAAANIKSAVSGEVSVWLDKVRQPDQKLTATVELELITNEDGAHGYKYQATLKHPALSKELVIRRQVVRFGRLTVVDATTEIDVLEDPKNKLVIKAKIVRSEEPNVQLKAQFSAKCEGLSLGAEAEGELVRQGNGLEAHAHYSFTRPNGQVTTRNIEGVLSLKQQSLLVGERAHPILLLSRSVQNLGGSRHRRSAEGNVLDTRYEVHLPGMADTRIVDVHLHVALPPHLDVKTYTTTPGRSVELSVGFPSATKFVAGVTRKIGSDSTPLAEYSTSLESNHMLEVKAQWNIEALREVLQTLKDRIKTAEDNLEDSVDHYVDNLTEDIKLTAERLIAALPNLAPLREHLATELQEIKSEWGQDRLSRTISQLLRVISDSLGGVLEPLEKALDILINLPQHIRELPKTIPALLKKYDKTLKSLKRVVGTVIASVLKAARPIIVQVQALVVKLDLPTKLNDIKAWRENSRARLIATLISRAENIDQLVLASDILSADVKDLLSTILHQVISKLKGEPTNFSEVSDKIREDIKHIIGEFLTVDLQNGVVSALIPLPAPIYTILDSVASGGKH